MTAVQPLPEGKLLQATPEDVAAVLGAVDIYDVMDSAWRMPGKGDADGR